jgi:hypothetical protein
MKTGIVSQLKEINATPFTLRDKSLDTELVDEVSARLALAILNNKFRDEVSLILNSVMLDAYTRGEAAGRVRGQLDCASCKGTGKGNITHMCQVCRGTGMRS